MGYIDKLDLFWLDCETPPAERFLQQYINMSPLSLCSYDGSALLNLSEKINMHVCGFNHFCFTAMDFLKMCVAKI